MALMNRIPGVANLYIGGLFALQQDEELKKACVTHIISVIRFPNDQDLPKHVKHLVVEVDDLTDENIIHHFPASNDFIHEGLEGGGGVFVHCAMGISRSTTIIIAYLLRQNTNLTPKTALAMVRECRPSVEPNTGFMSQLLLYHSMLCPASLDDHPVYQRWLYKCEVETSRVRGTAPGNIHFRDQSGAVDNMIYQRWLHEDQSSDSASSNTSCMSFPNERSNSSSFRCRRCRTSLATSQYLIQHDPPPSQTRSTSSFFSPLPTTAISSLSPTPSSPCAHFFLDPLSWMRTELEQGKIEGRLECPNSNCGANVGKYAWHGMRCSCGKWVVPGISIARGRVDEARER